MLRILYSLLFLLLLPLILLRLLWRSLKAPAYRQHIWERFGFVSAVESQACIWIHAVSVGETIASEQLVEQLLEQYPQHHIHITSMTPTGREEVRKRFASRVSQSYAPYDVPLLIAVFLRRIKPSVMLVMETELWPNTIHACHKRGVKTALLNGRMSESSARGYQKMRSLTRPMMQCLDLVAAQFAPDADRYQTLGVSKRALHEVGNIKFDIRRPENEQALKAELLRDIVKNNRRPIIMVASTHEGEDEYLLPLVTTIAEQSDIQPLWLWVPRHPERFDTVAELIAQQGLTYRRRSLRQTVDDEHVYLVDSMGELGRLYSIANIAVIGGSFIARGGHNMLEAALWNLPIITGDSDFNFSVISQQLQEAGAMQKVNDKSVMQPLLLDLLTDHQRREAMGLAGRQVLEKNQGSLRKTLGLLASLIES